MKGAIKLLLAVQPEVVAMWPAASTALRKQCQLWVKMRLVHLADPRQAEEAGEQVQGIALGLVKLSWMLPELVSMPARCPAGCKAYRPHLASLQQRRPWTAPNVHAWVLPLQRLSPALRRERSYACSPF